MCAARIQKNADAMAVKASSCSLSRTEVRMKRRHLLFSTALSFSLFITHIRILSSTDVGKLRDLGSFFTRRCTGICISRSIRRFGI